MNVAHSRQQSKTMTHKQITFRRRACISMLSPQHPFSPGSCVGPLRCGKILHAPGHPWPLSYGRQKLYVFVCVSGGERKGQRQRGRKDDGRNRRRMCFLWFHWQCGTANDFSSNEHENQFLFLAASTVRLPLPAQRLGALFWTIIIFVHRVLFHLHPGLWGIRNCGGWASLCSIQVLYKWGYFKNNDRRALLHWTCRESLGVALFSTQQPNDVVFEKGPCRFYTTRVFS